MDKQQRDLAKTPTTTTMKETECEEDEDDLQHLERLLREVEKQREGAAPQQESAAATAAAAFVERRRQPQQTKVTTTKTTPSTKEASTPGAHRSSTLDAHKQGAMLVDQQQQDIGQANMPLAASGCISSMDKKNKNENDKEGEGKDSKTPFSLMDIVRMRASDTTTRPGAVAVAGFASSVNDADASLLDIARMRASDTTARPGAVAVAGFASSVNDADASSDEDGALSVILVSSIFNDLVEAKPVQDDDMEDSRRLDDSQHPRPKPIRLSVQDIVVDPSKLRRPKLVKDRKHGHNENQKKKIALLVLVILVLLVVLGTAIGLKASKTNQVTNSNSNNTTSLPEQQSPPQPQLQLVLDALPPETVQAIQNDPQSPQARAHAWLQADPHLDHYPEWRKVQRFALATLYYATNTATGQDDRHVNSKSDWIIDEHWLDYDMNECHWSTKLDFQDILHVESDHIVHAMVEYYREHGVEARQGLQLADILHPAEGSHDEDPLGDPHEDHNTTTAETTDGAHPEEEEGRTTGAEAGSVTDHHDEDYRRRHLRRRVQQQQDNEDDHHDATYQEDEGNLHNEASSFSSSLPNYCDADGVYRRLWLYKMNLQGSLPPEVGLLSNLEIMDICGNPGIVGTLPSQIGQLEQLQFLFMEDNALTSTLPSDLGSLTQLRLLSLNAQPYLTGSLPTQLGLLKNLFYMSFPYNSGLSGPIPSEMGQLASNLQVLRLTSVGLTGTIPTELSLLTELTMLHVAENNFLQGSLPTILESLASLSHLQLLNFNGNALSGSLPANINHDGAAASSLLASSLFYLDLSNNDLTGSIPLAIVQNLPNIQVFNVAENLLTGQVPFVGMQQHWTQLERLDLHHNAMLQGTIPTTTTSSTNDSVFALHFTNSNLDVVLGGRSSSNWTKLQGLDIRETKIKGTIPDEYCELNASAGHLLMFTCSEALCGCSCPC